MEIEIEGRGKVKATYRVGTLSTFEQVHIARRLAPIMAGLMSGVASRMPDLESMSEMGVLEVMVGPASAAFAAMKQDDADYVMNTCLSVVERKVGDAWQRILAAKATLQYDDIHFPAMIKLIVAVVKENLGDFIPGLGGA